jgi:hypothetical protein
MHKFGMLVDDILYRQCRKYLIEKTTIENLKKLFSILPSPTLLNRSKSSILNCGGIFFSSLQYNNTNEHEFYSTKNTDVNQPMKFKRSNEDNGGCENVSLKLSFN